MIKVTVKSKNDSINEIFITGHANYDESGKDIVCASVSSICITTVNAILKLDNEALFYEEGEGSLKIIMNHHTDVIDLLVQNMIDLLLELEQDYGKYIKIMK